MRISAPIPSPILLISRSLIYSITRSVAFELILHDVVEVNACYARNALMTFLSLSLTHSIHSIHSLLKEQRRQPTLLLFQFYLMLF